MLTVTSDSSALDFGAIHAFLSRESAWARDIPAGTLRRAIDHSLCFAAFDGAQQIGFARVVTDRATFAYLCDVYVVATQRGRGVGRMLMDAVLAHPDLQGLRRFMLVTSTAHGLYQRYGFQPTGRAPDIMEILRPDAYVNQQALAA